MPVATCFASLQLAALRVAKLTSAGAPSAGATNGYCTNAAISLGVTLTVESGSEFTQKNGLDAICAYFKAPDRIKAVTFDIQLCQLDSSLIALMTGADTISSGGNIIGMQMPAVDADPAYPMCLEVWTKAWDGASQAVPAFTTPNPAYFHFVFPMTTWIQGPFTMEDGFMVVPLAGNGAPNTHITANGPYDDWAAAVVAVGGITRLGGWWLDDDLPTTQCGRIAVTSAPS